MEQPRPHPHLLNVAELLAQGDNLLDRVHRFCHDVEERIADVLAEESRRPTPQATGPSQA